MKSSHPSNEKIFFKMAIESVSSSVVFIYMRPHGPHSPSGSTVPGILQERILEWVAIPFSKGSYQPRDWTQVSFIVGMYFTF